MEASKANLIKQEGVPEILEDTDQFNTFWDGVFCSFFMLCRYYSFSKHTAEHDNHDIMMLIWWLIWFIWGKDKHVFLHFFKTNSLAFFG
mmetsp:Transcript_8406/g.12895  ORF Transcript_8406/g.12895 Transcript_8406/m.12895 type:complete len:89 (+) Transcript_8406:416-682(+)